MKTTITILLSLLLSFAAIAGKHDGIIVRLQGKAELLTNPSKKPGKGGPQVLLDGTYYTVKKARLGLKVFNGNILRTQNKSKVRIVYRNGDQINLAQASAYQVSWNPKKVKDDPSAINLMYGTIRGIVKKDGPRSGIKVKTRSAVMGIRGTDFNIAQNGFSGDTAVSVIRGNVEVNVKKTKKRPAQKLEVKQGQTAEVIVKKSKKKTTQKGKKKDVVEEIKVARVISTPKQDLVKIQKETTIPKPKKEEIAKVKKVAKQLDKLEKAAAKTTLNDIKEYDKKLYKEIKDKKVIEVDSINTLAVKKVAKKAPLKKMKFNVDSLDLSDEAFEEYFSIDE
jgi:hypothetical protein